MVTLSVAGIKPAHSVYRKSVKPASANMLKPGTNNAKLGRLVTAAKWQGSTMYSLSLEERKTCPSSCAQWDNCYGNNMPFAHRFDHTDPNFRSNLGQQLATLSAKHRDEGFVVRLHVLGDFFSMAYVDMWASFMTRYPKLRVFGYTHQPRLTAIGLKIKLLNAMLPERWVVRFSDDPSQILSAQVVKADHSPLKGTEVICPEQQGKTASCAACGLCWTALNRQILFIEH